MAVSCLESAGHGGGSAPGLFFFFSFRFLRPLFNKPLMSLSLFLGSQFSGWAPIRLAGLWDAAQQLAVSLGQN